MFDFLENSAFFGVVISVASYGLGLLLKKKFKLAILNPLLISIIITIAFLACTGISYEKYDEGAKYLSYLLTPATVCLAIPLYEQLELLKKNWHAVLIGILSGVLSSLGAILGMAVLFRFSHEEYVTFLPKSITTAIGMGNIFAEIVFRLFRIQEPVAKGIALGTASHAIGTAKAMELGEVEGAMSSLSIVVAGLITVIGATIFSHIM